MKTIKERASLAAWQIFEEIGLSKHSVDRVAAYNGSMSCVDDLLIEELCKAIGEQI